MYGKFRSLANALNFGSRTVKMSAVILGDDDQFWVVNLVTMERLLKAGYELA